MPSMAARAVSGLKSAPFCSAASSLGAQEQAPFPLVSLHASPASSLSPFQPQPLQGTPAPPKMFASQEGEGQEREWRLLPDMHLMYPLISNTLCFASVQANLNPWRFEENSFTGKEEWKQQDWRSTWSTLGVKCFTGCRGEGGLNSLQSEGWRKWSGRLICLKQVSPGAGRQRL